MSDTKLLDLTPGGPLLGGKGHPCALGHTRMDITSIADDAKHERHYCCSVCGVFWAEAAPGYGQLSTASPLPSFEEYIAEVIKNVASLYRIPPHLLGEAIPQPAFIKPLTDTELAQWEAQHICARAAKIIAERDPVEETDALHFTRLVVEADTPVTVEAKSERVEAKS